MASRMTADRGEEGWGLGEKVKGLSKNKQKPQARPQHGNYRGEGRKGEGEEGKGGVNAGGRRLDLGW